MNTTPDTTASAATTTTPTTKSATVGRPRTKMTRMLRIVKDASGNWIFPGRGRSADGTEIRFVTVPFDFFPAPKTVIDLSVYPETEAPKKYKTAAVSVTPVETPAEADAVAA